MPIRRATAGQVAVNEALPEAFRDYHRVLDKAEVSALLKRIASDQPEAYASVIGGLNDVGRMAAYRSGGYAYGLDDLKRSRAAQQVNQDISIKLSKLLARDGPTGRDLAAAIVKTVGGHTERMGQDIYDEAIAAKNPAALQVASGSRGSKQNLASLLGSDLLYTDAADQIVPIPITRSFSEGLQPWEYLAGTYGARKGVLGTKLSVADAGYMGKKLSQATHRLLITDRDSSPDEPETPRGLPVDTDDNGNVGSLLAARAGGYPRNTVLTPAVLKDLARQKVSKLLVRSPTVGGPPDGGLYAEDAGIREYGDLPAVGEQVGLTASQAISEQLAQGQLGLKHSGGVVKAVRPASGFKYIQQLTEIPKHFPGGAAHASRDGTVQKIEPLPAGGYAVVVDGAKHLVTGGLPVTVAVGDSIEAGDVLSEGYANPAEIVRHKGVGEGRRYLANALLTAFKNSGLKANRRGAEVLARGLIDHVELTGEMGEHLPGDVVGYQDIERAWTPRDGAVALPPSRAAGRYLERPVLHYTVGTKLRPSVIKTLADYQVPSVLVHTAPPPFEPLMVRATDNLRYDPDWLTRFYGSSLQRSFSDSVHRTSVSDEASTSFVPALAKSVGFGEYGTVRSPKRAAELDAYGLPQGASAMPPSSLNTPQAHSMFKSWLNAEQDPQGALKRMGHLVLPGMTHAPGDVPDYAGEMKQWGNPFISSGAAPAAAGQLPKPSGNLLDLGHGQAALPHPQSRLPSSAAMGGGVAADAALTSGPSLLRGVGGWLGGAKNVGSSLLAGAGMALKRLPGVAVAWDALASTPDAYNLARTGITQGRVDPEVAKKYTDLARELSTANPLQRMLHAVTSPIQTIGAGIAGAYDAAGSHADMQKAIATNRGLEAGSVAMQAPRMNELEEKHQRWAEHVRTTGADPNAPFMDPVTKTYYTRGEYDDLTSHRQRVGQTDYQRETKGLGFDDRLGHDIMNSRLAVPFFQPARIPGTSIQIPSLFS